MKKFYLKVNNESLSAMFQRYYGNFHSTLSEALESIEEESKDGDSLEVVDESGNVFASINRGLGQETF